VSLIASTPLLRRNILNVYKSKYRLIIEKLNTFGNGLKKIKLGAKYTKDFWEEMVVRGIERGTWDCLIVEYLIYECNEYERLFIDLVFFQKKNITQVGFIMHLSTNACYYRSTVILNDLICLAIQFGLLTIYFGEEKSETVCCVESIEAYKVEKVYRLLSKNKNCRIKNLQNVLDAINLVETTRIVWRDLPKQYGSWKTIYNIYSKWRKSGILDKIKDILA